MKNCSSVRLINGLIARLASLVLLVLGAANGASAAETGNGVRPAAVELDGILCDESGNPRPNATVDTAVTVGYDDGVTVETNLVLKTADGGLFGLSVPVDGPDGRVHNVKSIVVSALGPNPITVTAAPYALTATEVDMIDSAECLPLVGDGVTIGSVAAQSLAVSNAIAVGGDTFKAGSLKGFKEIDLGRVAVAGGQLDWFGGAAPAEQNASFANLVEMTIGGGVPAEVDSALSCAAGSRETRTWTAANDGFFQLQAKCPNPQSGELQLELVENDSPVVEVTPMGTVGRSSDVARRLIWTVPVRKGQTVRLTLKGGQSSAFELSSVKAQFVYFGVVE